MKEHEHPYWLQHTSEYTDRKTGHYTGLSGGDLGKGTYSRLDSAKRKAEQYSGKKLNWETNEEGHHIAESKGREGSDNVNRHFR